MIVCFSISAFNILSLNIGTYNDCNSEFACRKKGILSHGCLNISESFLKALVKKYLKEPFCLLAEQIFWIFGLRRS